MINKIIHIYRKYECICDIAKEYNVNPYDICVENDISNVDYIKDFTPLVIPIDTKCNEVQQLYCNVEKRGCYGCYYFK